jgi:hypothetical protein
MTGPSSETTTTTAAAATGMDGSQRVRYNKYTTSQPLFATSNDSRDLLQDDEKSPAAIKNTAFQMHAFKPDETSEHHKLYAVPDDDVIVVIDEDNDVGDERRLLVTSLKSVASQLAELRGFIRRLWSENSSLYRELMQTLTTVSLECEATLMDCQCTALI